MAASAQQQVVLQHVNVKLFLADAASLDLEPLIPIFHSWITGAAFNEMLLDVADYRHVPSGPGVVVIGHEADYAVDNADGRLGVRYNRKTAVEGDNSFALQQAARAALTACRRLEEEPRLDGKLRFDGQRNRNFRERSAARSESRRDFRGCAPRSGRLRTQAFRRRGIFAVLR